MIEIIAGYIAGGYLYEKLLGGKSPEQPYWQAQIGETEYALLITQLKRKGVLVFRLYMVGSGQSTMVATGDYPSMLLAVQAWQTYVLNGGSITEWLTQNETRAAEIAQLEQGL
jgi:hypothetical protein